MNAQPHPPNFTDLQCCSTPPDPSALSFPQVFFRSVSDSVLYTKVIAARNTASGHTAPWALAARVSHLLGQFAGAGSKLGGLAAPPLGKVLLSRYPRGASRMNRILSPFGAPFPHTLVSVSSSFMFYACVPSTSFHAYSIIVPFM